MDKQTKKVDEDKHENAEPSTSETKRGRRGKGSKSKQAEIFRSKKNKDFDDKMIKKIEDIKISFGYTPQQLFGDRSLTSIISPQVKIPVNISQIGALTTLVAEVLHHACKIPPPSEEAEDAIIAFDDETLKWVCALQLESKIYFARAGSQYSQTNLEVVDRAQRTAQLLPRALIPLAVVIDQIGRFTLQNQLFVPVPNLQDDFLYYRLANLQNAARLQFRSLVVQAVQEGVLTTHTDQQGRRLRAIPNAASVEILIQRGIITADGHFTLAFLQNPAAFDTVGLVNFVPETNHPAPPTFSEIVRRYTELEGRVSKKLANVFVEVELNKGKGVESQIVFRQNNGDGTCVAWSPRVLRADAFEMGAVLGLGYPCLIGSRDCAANLCTIDLSAGLECLANVLTKKMR